MAGLPAPVSAPTGGRRRDPAIDQRVLEATRASLVEHGWEGTSIRGIAQRAGVSRPAIVRRWPSKAHLALESLLGPEPDLVAFEDVDLRGWIDGVIDGSFLLFEQPAVRSALPALLAALRDHEDLRQGLWDGFTGPPSALAVLQGAGGPRAARAAIAVAAGAAMFSSVVIGDDPALLGEVRALLRTTLRQALLPVGADDPAPGPGPGRPPHGVSGARVGAARSGRPPRTVQGAGTAERTGRASSEVEQGGA